MELRLKHTVLRLDWLMILFPVCAAFLGESSRIHLWLLSLFLHETAHLTVARLVHIPIRCLRVTPFGGPAQIDNPYTVSESDLCALAAAGPAANLLAILLAATLCRWNLLPVRLSGELISVNAALMLFNLLPALPLDGGRILCAVLGTFISRERAVKTCVFFGRILAVLLLAALTAALLIRRRLNLSFLISAIFLLVSAEDELRASRESNVQTFLNSMRPLTKPMHAELIAIDASCSARTALRAARPDRVTLFAIYDDNRFSRLTDDRTLLREWLKSTSDPSGKPE